ncbi:MAG: hypothetical protein ABFS56_20745 [Pseudomonadota bacterium]
MKKSTTLLTSILLIALSSSVVAQMPEEGQFASLSFKRQNSRPYFDFATNTLNLPTVEVSTLGTYMVSMKLDQTDPLITFDLHTAKAVTTSSQATAYFDPKNGLLKIPAVQVGNEVFVVEFLWDWNVTEVMRFTLIDIRPISDTQDTPPYPSDAQLAQIHKDKEVSFNDITYQISEKVTDSYGKKYYFSKYGRLRGGAYGVYIPQIYDGVNPLPLVVASHGAMIMGPRELRNWTYFAEQYGFIVVTPSYLVATNYVFDTGFDMSIHLMEEDSMTKDIVETIVNALKVDTSNILGTGFSGGGYPTYLFMMNYPEYFTALCMRSPDYSDEYQIPFDKEKWKNRPIYVFWGENDLGVIKDDEGPKLLNYLLAGLDLIPEYNNRTYQNSFISRNGMFKWDAIPNSGHEHHADLTSQWFINEVVQ